MPDSKDIADYYLDRYRGMVSFANKALGIALLILLINWATSLEPRFESINNANHQYKVALKKNQKKQVYAVEQSHRIKNQLSFDKNAQVAIPAIKKHLITRLDSADRQLIKLSDTDYENIQDTLTQIESINERLQYDLKDSARSDSIVKRLAIRSLYSNAAGIPS